eukprot:TRINITY_DN1505_c0_g3_i1.p1 TRINITY_DN1505_c0_g3~~TRINITY_DN1505_c0_g3_i1.p1  ORF type:complete len:263 (-),score=13.09 TRINITY_DN1505_c0_g3_i1:54-842(-)
MTAVAFTGYLLLGLGPGIVFFWTVIAPKSLLILLSLTSAFVWLIALMIIAALWRGLLPLGSSVGPYVPLLLTAVAIQEVVRFGCWKIYVKLEVALEGIASKRQCASLSVIDRIQMLLAIGWGHGGVHSAIFFLSLLTPALGPATFYVDACPQLPLFLVAALMSLAFLVIHTFSTLIAFDGYSQQGLLRKAFVPTMHLTAALLSLVNFVPSGCLVGIPLALTCATATLLLSGKLVYDRTKDPGPRQSALRSTTVQTVPSTSVS